MYPWFGMHTVDRDLPLSFIVGEQPACTYQSTQNTRGIPYVNTRVFHLRKCESFFTSVHHSPPRTDMYINRFTRVFGDTTDVTAAKNRTGVQSR